MDLSNLDATALIAILLAVFAILGFLKTAVKLFFLVIALGVGLLAGLWGYNNGFTLAHHFFDQVEPWMPTAVGGIAFAGAFSAVRAILSFFTGRAGEDSQGKTLGFGMPGGLLGMAFGGLLLYGVLSGVRYGGTLAELDHLQDYVSGKIQKSADSPVLARLKDWIDHSKIGQIHQKIDFFNDDEAAEIAKIAIVKQDEEIARALPVDDRIPMAFPVNDDMVESIRTGDFNSLLRKARELGIDVDAEKMLRRNIERELGLRD